MLGEKVFYWYLRIFFRIIKNGSEENKNFLGEGKNCFWLGEILYYRGFSFKDLWNVGVDLGKFVVKILS